MATYNLRGKNRPVNVAQAGQLGFHLVEFDYADTDGAAGLANGDIIQFDGVPRGHKLVPHLLSVAGNEFDSNASPTATFKVGTDAADDSLIAGAVGGVAAPHALSQGVNVPAAFAAVTGSKTADTPLVLTVTAAVATAVTSGKLTILVPYTPFAE